ncbi:MAG TPA: ankyrin repeat domain-containing protein [Polyangiaceae bacterium]
MKELPQKPDLAHLKKQAKELLKAARARESAALERLRAALPAAAGKDDASLRAMDLRLHDAQSCIAREYGFPSWAQLKDYVETQSTTVEDAPALRARWAVWAFGAGLQRAKPLLAARLLREHKALLAGDPSLAAAVGDVATVLQAIAADPQWARQRGSSTARSPLLRACFSGLVRLPEFAPGIRECAARLLAAGADPNDSLTEPAFPGDPQSALYGAAGRNHDAALTRTLLDAGADPNDGESLYHAAEAADPECVRLLLEGGARVEGSNALMHALDYERPSLLALLLAHGGDPNERIRDVPLTHALRRRRSKEIVRMLLDAGADPRSRDPNGVPAYRLAVRLGLTDVAAMLREAGASEADDPTEAFLAACARADREAAEALLAGTPNLIAALDETRLRLLPELAGSGCSDAVRLMVDLGWPVAVRGGDIDGSALNHAVFRGDSALASFLVAHGARYDERHGYGDNVYGTLNFASLAETTPGGDWLGCAKALIEGGNPLPEERYTFADDVADYFEELRKSRQA